MKVPVVRRLLVIGAASAALVVGLAGCPLPGTGVTISGWFVAYYFDITSDVTVKVTQGDLSVTVDAPVATYGSDQSGAFLVAGVPTGTYAGDVRERLQLRRRHAIQPGWGRYLVGRR
jgi:hypothetical protein